MPLLEPSSLSSHIVQGQSQPTPISTSSLNTASLGRSQCMRTASSRQIWCHWSIAGQLQYSMEHWESVLDITGIYLNTPITVYHKPLSPLNPNNVYWKDPHNSTILTENLFCTDNNPRWTLKISFAAISPPTIFHLTSKCEDSLYLWHLYHVLLSWYAKHYGSNSAPVNASKTASSSLQALSSAGV